jgi:membrane protein
MLAAMLAGLRSLLADAARSYSRHGGRMLAGAVAFSSLLSIAPLLYIALGVAGMAIGDDRGRASVMRDFGRWIGEDGAQTIFSLLERASTRERSGIASVIGGIVLVYASTRLFSQMKRALNHMWDVHARSGKGLGGKVWKQLRKRAFALLIVLFVGVLIIAAVAVKTMLAAATGELPGGAARTLYWLGEWVVSLGTTTLMFAAIFKVLPDVRLQWHDALRGALVTAVLFSIGTTIIGLYLGHKALDVLYGPGGSVVMLLLFVHYSAQVFFFGAAVTGELARRRGHAIEPNEYGVRIVIEDGTEA